MKYIIYECLQRGLETPVIFPSYLNHGDTGRKITAGGRVLSAGFCQITSEGKFITFGRSESIGLNSREQDSDILNMMLD